MTAWRPRANLEHLRRRAALVDRTRAFFAGGGVLEVDTPVLQGGANLDHGVSPLRVDTSAGPRFLPTSPEHPLKRLVAAGCGPVWALAPAFRADEHGRRHRSEFRMLEWYRPGWDDVRLREEVLAYVADLSGLGEDHETLTWREAYRRYTLLDPIEASDGDLRRALGADAAAATDRAAALDLLMVTRIEPNLGQGQWTFLVDYPATAAAQARIRRDADGQPVAARFELYRDGLELANGYHECTDADDLAQRLEAERRSRGDADRLVHDQRFAAAMQAGLGDCAGVAIGFDRLVMLILGVADVGETLAFPFEIA